MYVPREAGSLRTISPKALGCKTEYATVLHCVFNLVQLQVGLEEKLLFAGLQKVWISGNTLLVQGPYHCGVHLEIDNVTIPPVCQHA